MNASVTAVKLFFENEQQVIFLNAMRQPTHTLIVSEKNETKRGNNKNNNKQKSGLRG